MSSEASGERLQRAQECAGRGEWQQAFELLSEAEEEGSLGVADLPLLGDVAYATGHLDLTIEAWERAYAGLLQAGEQVPAAGAAVRVAMHLLFDTALMAPVRGWLSRAETLLGNQPEAAPHAWFAVVRNYERLLSGDLDGARQWARRAVDIGSRCDRAACAIGRVAEARLLILDGEVEEGLALLGEAGVDAVSGDLDPMSTGVVYCELVCALQGLAQYDLAEQWTEAMERWARTNAIGSLHGRCRVHRAEILRLRGHCDEAEAEALAACEELRPYLRRELGWPLTELARIRLRKRDVTGAEDALLRAHHAGWDAQPGLALVQLAHGDVRGAQSAVRDALDRPLNVPSKELPPSSDLRRAPLLDAQVEIELAAGDTARARSAADELDAVATRFQSKALRACATYNQGRVLLAEGDATQAEKLLAEAARAWTEIGAPYEAALTRLGLAAAHRATGSDHRAELEQHAARAILDRIETSRDTPAGVAAARSSVPTGSFRREGDHWAVSFDGTTIRVRDLKGIRYLVRLLAEPGREFHVLDLVATESGHGARTADAEPSLSAVRAGDAGELLDARAKEAYRRRLAEIEDDIDEARACGDAMREAQAEVERDFLVRELARAVGLGGRDRRAGSASERARVAVTRAVRQALARLAEHHPSLGEHLDHAVRTGTYCVYLPDPRVPAVWDL